MKRLAYCSITLITSPGKGLALVERLFKQGLAMVDVHHARGSLVGAPVKRNGTPVETEQEIVTCVVEASRADEIFGLIFELAEVNQPGGGLMYLQRLDRSTELKLSA